MSVIDAISIQGIRSFDPNIAQILEFFKPVTLILGQNGTGKTTIIESLKYATTGDLPPGAKVGASFIHDPRIAKEPEVKAKVTLQMRDVKGIEMIISRALKAVQKDNKQASMQTLDSSIKRIQPDGESVSISSKCADIDFEVTNSLGVSKAVLESVIFCHQEEANWPLMEGKVVKQRFDDLFASARYVKVLEAIRKTKLEKDGSVKLLRTELKYIQDDRNLAKQKLVEKNQLMGNLLKIEDQIELVKEKIVPVEKFLNDNKTKYQEICKLENKIQNVERNKIFHETRARDMKKNISQVIEGSVDELNDMLKNLDSEFENLKVLVKEKEVSILKFKKEISGWEKSNGESLVGKGSLQIKMETLKSNKNKFQQSLLRLSTDLNVEYDETSPTMMIRRFQDRIHEEEIRLQEKKKVSEEDINKHQNDVDSKNAEKAKMKHECELLERQLKNNKKDLTNIEKKLSDIDESSVKLDLIGTKINNLKNQLNLLKETFDSSVEKERIEEFNTNIKTYEEKLEELSSKLSQKQVEENKYKELEKMRQQLADKNVNIKRLRSRHADVLSKIFDNEIPESGLRKKLNDKLCELRSKIQEIQTSINEHQSKFTTLNVEVKQIRQKISEKKNIVQKFEEKVFEVYGNFDFEKSLSEIKEKKASLEEDLVSIQGTCTTFKKFQDNLEKQKDKHDCPLCHREFHEDSEKNELLEEISQKLSDLPPLLKNKTAELVTVNLKYENLLKLESKSQHISELKKDQISELETSLATKMKQLTDEQESLANLNKDKEKLTESEKQANMIQGDIAVVEKLHEEVNNIEKQITMLSASLTLGKDDFFKDFDKLRQEKSTVQNDLAEQKKVLESKRKSYDQSMNKENKLTAEINKLDGDRLSIQQNVTDFTNLWSQKEKLISEIGTIHTESMKKKQSLEPIDNELDLLKEKLTTVKRRHGLEENDIREKITHLKSKVADLDRTWKNIQTVEKDDFQSQLKALEEKRFENMKKIEQNNAIIAEVDTAIDDIKTKISERKIHQRELQDTISIRDHETNATKLESDIMALQTELGESDSQKLQVEEKKMEADRKQLQKEIDTLETKKTQYSTQKDYIEKELQKRFSGVEAKYMDIFYKLKTTELASQDLEKYYRALDKSIMTYHSSKMEEINKILKELWRNTYSGKDIDYIEICSDEDGTGSGTGTSRRRAYNYRVVMVKTAGTSGFSGNTSLLHGSRGARLDMRSRCSAGQKVLASLLIRLALAEVFCLHCGVLALDEPTTNLDQENIENLAYALVQIIKNRCRQKNFQLIIITHDEDFVELLGRSDYVEEFYKIQCDNNGHSKVLKMGIDNRQ